MKFFTRIRISSHGEGGFSLAEVMMAGLILVIAVLPMTGMFDGAFQASQAAYDLNLSQECMRLYAEQVLNIPFYQAHDESDLGVALDVDDHYWGSRSPIYDNTWSDAPHVLAKDYGTDPYPDLKVEIRMAYLDDSLVEGRSLEEAANLTQLDTVWTPRDAYGSDKPITPGGKPLNLIIYEILVTSQKGGTVSDVKMYAAPTGILSNVYIDKIINVSADSTKQGTRYNDLDECISAPHNKNDITVRVYGQGFTETDVQGGLVDVKLVVLDDVDVDLDFDPATAYDVVGGYIEGNIDLHDALSSADPWALWQCRRPEYWDGWLVVDHVISVREDVFVVEYPSPVYHAGASDFNDSDGDKEGLESETDEVITFAAVDYCIQFDPIQYGSVGVIIQLVHSQADVDTGDPLDVINGKIDSLIIDPDSSYGYQTDLEVSAHFDFTGHIGGKYKVRVINCIDRSNPSINTPGNTYFEVEYDPDDPDTYYELQGPPRVDSAYVYEEVPVTTDERHFAFDSREYPYTLEIKGYNFDNLISPLDIKLGYAGDISSDPPVGLVEIGPDSSLVVDENTLRADFTFTDAKTGGNYGRWWLYVRNSNGFGYVLENAFDILEPAPIIYDYSVESYGFWQNYFDVDVQLIGECFNTDALNGEYIDVMIREESVPANDWLANEAMTDPVSSDFGRQLDCAVNLVECDTGVWWLYALDQPAGTTECDHVDDLASPAHDYRTLIEITMGAPRLLTDGVPTDPLDYSLMTQSRYRGCDNAGVWSDWSDWYPSVEGTLFGGSYNAWIWENDPDIEVQWRTEGEMYFEEIRGMGFNKDGTISVQVKNNDAPQGPGMDADWNNLTVMMDRTAPKVWVEMDDPDTDKRTTGPDEGGYARIRLYNSANSTWCDWYINRIRIRSEG
ncbi:MAG: hypothetical protein SWK76_16165 [Actinomycetota bacterium]|nr:hypothetical protein [Actinomycetota bacterium]